MLLPSYSRTIFGFLAIFLILFKWWTLYIFKAILSAPPFPPDVAAAASCNTHSNKEITSVVLVSKTLTFVGPLLFQIVYQTVFTVHLFNEIEFKTDMIQQNLKQHYCSILTIRAVCFSPLIKDSFIILITQNHNVFLRFTADKDFFAFRIYMFAHVLMMQLFGCQSHDRRAHNMSSPVNDKSKWT